MGLWDKFKSAFGKKRKDEEPEEDVEYYGGKKWRPVNPRGEEPGQTFRMDMKTGKNWVEVPDDDGDSAFGQEPIDFDAVTEPDLSDVKAKAEERDQLQQEYEDAIAQVKQERERIEQETKTEAGTKAGTTAAKPAVDAETQEYIRHKRALELEKAQLEVEKTKGSVAETPEKMALERAKLQAQTKLIEQKRREARSKGMENTAKRFTGIVKGVSTLGGAVRISKARKGYYVPKMEPSRYIPTGMKELTTPSAGHGMQTSTLRRVGTPSYEKLRQATTFKPRQATAVQPRMTTTSTSPIARMATGTPRHLAKPMGFVKIGSQAQDVAMERLRGLTFPTGLTNTEKLAYAEIKANHDIDTKAHVVSELMDLGIEKLEASRAIEGLLHRKIVKRGKPFDGEPTLEVA